MMVLVLTMRIYLFLRCQRHPQLDIPQTRPGIIRRRELQARRRTADVLDLVKLKPVAKARIDRDAGLRIVGEAQPQRAGTGT